MGTAGRAYRARRAAAGALLAASLAVAGCGAAGQGDSGAASAPRADKGSARGEQGMVGPKAPADGKAGSGAGSGTGKPTPVSTAQIIRTASVTVEAADVPGALAKARTAVKGAGGYVEDESTDRDGEGRERSRAVLRVPPGAYDGLLDRLSRLGTLKQRQVSAKDVTDQVVDTDSRIKSQQASVARVRALMDKATSIGDIVTLESELSRRQSELESLQARLKSLKEQTGMATVTLVLREPDAADDDRETTFGDALSGGWDAFTAGVRWLLVAVGAALPFLAAGALVYALWRVLRGRLPRRTRSLDVPPAPPRQFPTEAAPEGTDAAREGDGPGGR
ncbi:DUF4349 domain-containing protein [Streptomyces albofaciens JCM 4342]|uniref:DUF4349 domain-containing protein n=1 Tax=Streptomyces albofaciens TaxID=66866 RepID=UPI00123BC3DF|nr:DUF4349 domain-containing protein [Streptomyces albofaciens]KAA6213321.1 DUF4349 domain-containing protein [Streptomyces albofaciens JCM 4342]